MRTVMCLGLSKRIPARPTAPHAMETTPITPTMMRFTRWRLVNFTASPPASGRRGHERREPVVVLGCATCVAVRRSRAEVDVPRPRRVVDARHGGRARDLHLALLLATARPLVGFAMAAAGVHPGHLG